MENVQITASVGQGGKNVPPDVMKVQSLLGRRGFNAGRIDGLCGTKTIGAILAFQRQLFLRPDGLVNVGGPTWKRLAAPEAHGQAPSLTALVPKPASHSINTGLVSASNAQMTSLLGAPRSSYSQDCQPPTNDALKRNMKTASMGNFSVTGLAPAVASLRAVMDEIKSRQPAVHAALGTAGMFCCRYQRGSNTKISNHSWGTAIDLTLNKVLDVRGDDKVQYGLTLIAPIFNEHGWYWGAAFPTEDGMHFEAGLALVQAWGNVLGGA